MKNLSENYRYDRIPWGVYVSALAELIDKPAEIVGSYLSAHPWCAIGQRVCETYHVDYAHDGGYPCMIDRECVAATSIAELCDLASSMHGWEMQVYRLYSIARNAGLYGSPDIASPVAQIQLAHIKD